MAGVNTKSPKMKRNKIWKGYLLINIYLIVIGAKGYLNDRLAGNQPMNQRLSCCRSVLVVGVGDCSKFHTCSRRLLAGSVECFVVFVFVFGMTSKTLVGKFYRQNH